MMKPNFSLDDFKKWMKNQKDLDSLDRPQKHKDVIGTHVESKISSSRLSSVISAETDNIQELAFDFKKNGGTIEDIDGKNFIIEVDSGTFIIPRHHVKPI